MSRALRRQIGRLLIGSFSGHALPPELRSLAREFDLGGVILFARNVDAPQQVAEISYGVQQLGGDEPRWVSVDQEGGRVARLRAPFTEWPPMATLGRSGDDHLAERFAHALAAELRAVGVSLVYAPVLDVHTNPHNTVIGDRALADRPELVARLGSVVVRTLQREGVAACGKHFPGHGGTPVDSHHELPIVEEPLERLRAVELLPFRAAIDAQVGSIMVGHLLVPALDELRPATLSSTVIQSLLRSDLAYDGVVFTDDLEMRAIADRFTVPEAAVSAVAAGCDGVLVCGGDLEKQAATLEAMVHAVESERLPVKRVEEALARQRRLKERFLEARPAGSRVPPPLSKEWRPAPPDALAAVIGRGEHRAVADEMARYV